MRISSLVVVAKGPFGCYVTQYGVGVKLGEKTRYKSVHFNVIGVSGCQISRKKALRNTRLAPNVLKKFPAMKSQCGIPISIPIEVNGGY